MSTAAGKRSQKNSTIRATPSRVFFRTHKQRKSSLWFAQANTAGASATSTYASRAGCILRACPPLPWTAVGRTSHANMQGGGRCVAVGIRSFSRARTCPGFIMRQLLRLCPEILFGRPKMKCIVLTSEGLSVSLGFSFCSGKEMLWTAELLDEQSTLLLLSTKRNDA